jgi:hypothetical protein
MDRSGARLVTLGFGPALAAAALLAASPALATTTPKPGTYQATTNQCGTLAAPHPCYTFRFKISRGRCPLPLGHVIKRGYCLTTIGVSVGTLVSLDVTCPDSQTFASPLLGPLNKLLLSPTGSLKYSSHSGVEEGGKEFVEGRESLTLFLKGGHGTGTLTLLAQENIGLETPQCTSGNVKFTAKLA